MTDAYKVGITIALTNKISQGLMLISRDLAKTNAQAAKLQATLKEIKLLGIGGAILGGIGYAGFKALDKTLDAAKQYEQAFAQFKSLKLGDAINTQADKFARGASVIGASATDLMVVSRDLTAVLGDRGQGMVQQLAPGFAQLKYANQAVYGGHGLDFNEKQLRDLERIVEMKGGFKSAQDFLAQAGMIQQVIAGTGGLVKPSDYLAFIKTAGVAGRLLDNKSFYYGMEPLIQEMGGNRVGTGLMSLYSNLGQGRVSTRSAKELMRLGLVDPSMVEYDKIGQLKQIRPGALKGMDEFGANPYQWMKDVLLPSFAAKGITSEKGVLNEISTILPNRVAANLVSLMFLQMDKIEKNMALSQGAMGTDDLVTLARSSPQGAEMALGKAWKNLEIAAGEVLIPIVIPALNKLAEVIRDIGKWINQHPVKFEWIVKIFASLSGLALLGGGLMLTSAFFKLLVPALTMLTGLNLAGAATGIGFLTAALGPLVTVALAVANSDKIGALVSGTWADKYNPFSAAERGGEALGHWLKGDKQGSDGSWAPPPPANKSSQSVGNVYLDSHRVGTIVSQHQADAGSRPPNSGSGFDSRYFPMWAGVGY